MSEKDVNFKDLSMGTVSDENIINLLQKMSINYEGYFFGTIMPKSSTYALLGALASTAIESFIVVYDAFNVYLISLGLTGMKIKRIDEIPFASIQSIIKKDAFLDPGVNLTINTKENQKIVLICSKKIKTINNQLDSINRLQGKFNMSS